LIEGVEQRGLDVFALRPVLLDEVGVLDRARRIVDEGHSVDGRASSEADPLEHRPVLGHG
jgi:hypothetical protein